MKPIRIDQWRTVHARPLNLFRSPESCGIAVSGVVAPGEDPRMPEGCPITTSEIVSVDGHQFRTRSGTLYVLGTIDPKFREWLRVNRPNWNPEQPITMK